MRSNFVKCKICGQEFNSISQLHSHLKTHKILQGDYYLKYFARKNLLNGTLLPYTKFDTYFLNDFRNENEFYQWLKISSKSQIASYLPTTINKRIRYKKYQFAPPETELKTCSIQVLPYIRDIRLAYNSYEDFCNKNNFNIMFKDRDIIVPNKNIKIAIDTREQKPFELNNGIIMKLDIGDYTALGEDYSNTYIDRKSTTDFIGTITTGFSRFQKELERAVILNAFIFILVESTISDLKQYNKHTAHKVNLDYVFHNMHRFQHMFPKNCQFVFCDGRENCIKTLNNILKCGKEIWELDAQYLVEKGII